MSKIDNPDEPQYEETKEQERALKGKFVSCNVQYRDKNRCSHKYLCSKFLEISTD